MKNISILIKPASSLCNLKCKYCFYDDIASNRAIKSHGIMTNNTARALIKNTFASLEDGDEISFSFQGGEPTLAGLPFFENFVAEVLLQKKRVATHFLIQTNGILINDEWCDFLSKNNFLVGLSLDCVAHTHNENRVDANGKSTYNLVMHAKALFDKHKIKYNILTVLTQDLARRSSEVWNFLQKNNIKFVQFVPCLDVLNPKKKSDFALTPRKFAQFYNTLFKLWERNLYKGNYLSIRLFDDIINLIAKGEVNACGITGQCGAQHVIEADGSVYPCDFYVLDEHYSGNICEMTLKELYEANAMRDFVMQKKVLPKLCEQCKYLNLCNFGCKRMKNSMYIADDENYCGYKDFLDTNIDSIIKIAKSI